MIFTVRNALSPPTPLAFTTGACLRGADLSGSDLTRADLRRAANLSAEQLLAADGWQAATRDPGLACGAQIPGPYDPMRAIERIADERSQVGELDDLLAGPDR